MRLVDGPSPHAGRVEVYASTEWDNIAQWGTVCHDFWDIQDARVVCRQLGYADAVAAPLSAHYGQGSGQILLDNVQCLGTERDIFSCLHNEIDINYCYHFEDASAECLGK